MIRALIGWTLRWWPALALVTSAAMLAIAHAFETFGHLAPCHLCLLQRDVYWWALPICAAAVLVAYGGRLAVLKPWLGAAMGAAFLVGCGIAVYHAGAEWKFWPGPASCSGGSHAVNAAALSDLLKGATLTQPRCDVAAWRFLWLSMAGWNALISLKLAVWSLVWAAWSRKR
ncbi:MAG TPA: disulfide bond formation protein B [Caulobacteraceae bacterium]|nr:disulfide bond formation protein B [Caulobacteraceae bacterium]